MNLEKFTTLTVREKVKTLLRIYSDPEYSDLQVEFNECLNKLYLERIIKRKRTVDYDKK